MDYEKLKIGDKVSTGIVVFIYAAGSDFVVFREDSGQDRVITKRKDDVFTEASKIAVDLTAKAFKKRNRVDYETTSGQIMVCVAQALAHATDIDDLEEIFKPASEYVKKIKPIKRILGQGSNPEHMVYITRSGRPSWQYKLLPEYCKAAMAQLTGLAQQCVTILPSLFRASVAVSIGNAALTVIRSNQSDDLVKIVEVARNDLHTRIQEFHKVIFTLSAFIFFIVASLASYQFDLLANFYVVGMLGGGFGALISILQRTTFEKFSLYESLASITAQTCFRMLIGLASGFLLVIASRANIAFGFLDQSLESIFVFSVAAGFTERWIPDLLGSLSKEKQ